MTQGPPSLPALQITLACDAMLMSESGGPMWERNNHMKVQIRGPAAWRISAVLAAATAPPGAATHKLLPPPPPAGQKRYDRNHPGLMPHVPRTEQCQAQCTEIVFAGPWVPGFRPTVLLANGAWVR